MRIFGVINIRRPQRPHKLLSSKVPCQRSLMLLKGSLRSTPRPFLHNQRTHNRNGRMRVLQIRTLPHPILAQLPTYSPTMHLTAAIRHLKDIYSSIKIRCRIHSIPIFLLAHITTDITRPCIRGRGCRRRHNRIINRYADGPLRATDIEENRSKRWSTRR